jgi:uncharacterized membrane-anchored protein
MLGASAAGTVYLAFAHLGRLGSEMHPFWNASTGLALAWIAGLVLQSRIAIDAGRWRCAAALESTLGGWLMATLAVLAVSSGMSLLVGGVLGGGATGIDFTTGRAQASPANWTSWLTGSGAFSIASLVVAWAWGVTRSATRKALLRGPLALALLIACALLSLFMPSLGLVAALGLLAFVTGRPWQASVACLAAAWIIGAFYYQLAWTLETKALVLLAAGVVLGAVAWLVRSRSQVRGPSPPGSRAGLAWTATGLLATLAVVNIGIWQKEEVIARGRPVFIELAPVDPRSLMQGDYMALNYRMSDELRQQLHQAGTLKRPRVAATVDERGVARLDRLASAEMPADQLAIELTPKNGGWVVASDAWFFREGEGSRYQEARYGEFRVDRDGRALLVGLADQQLRRIGP